MTDWWKDAITAASFSVSAFGFLWGVLVYRRTALRQARQASLDYVEKVRTEASRLDDEIMKDLGLNRDAARLPRGVAQEIATDNQRRDTRDKIWALLSSLEHLALSARIGVFDVETIERLRGGKILRYYNFYVDYIDVVREQPGEGSSTYEELIWLARQLCKLQRKRGIECELARPSPRSPEESSPGR